MVFYFAMGVMGIGRKTLTKKQCDIAAAVFNGMTQTEVAQMYGVSVISVSSIMKRDDVKKMQYNMACDVMRDGAVRAARLLVKQLDDENQWIAQNAARTILQWEKERQEDEQQTITVTFEGMADPDKVQQKMNAVIADGEVE